MDSTKSFGKLIVFTLLSALMVMQIDKSIEGRWRDYPPFSFLTHPHPDFHRTFLEQVQNYGYHAEEHFVQTDDGYINQIFRISKFKSKKQNDRSVSKPAVLLLHGHLESSDSWIVNGPNNSMGYVLAEQGYDVWLANSRCNKYSERHDTLNPEKDDKYWDGCLSDKMALYDIPAFINRIKKKTSVEKVSVIAHSLGTYQMLMGLQLNTTFYQQSVNYIILLSPFHKLKRASFVVEQVYNFLAYVDKEAPKSLKPFRTGSPTPVLKYICGYAIGLCDSLMLRLAAHSHSEFIDYERLKIFFSMYPSQSGLKNWRFVSQLLKSGKHEMYDYGEDINLQQYGTKHPKQLNIEDVKKAGIPISIVAAKHDNLVFIDHSLDVKDLLGDTLDSFQMIDGGHIHYFIGNNLHGFFQKVIKDLKKHNPV